MAKETTATHWMGFDLGGTKMLAMVYDKQFQSCGKRRMRTKGHEGAAVGIDRIVTAIGKALENAQVSPEQLGGIGVGCPSPVDTDKGVVLDAVNLGWKDVPLKKHLEKEFGCPVALLNDVDAGVYGENQFGAAQAGRTVLGVFPGTGIGGGCVYGGRIVHGKSQSCMEIGHVQVTQNGNFCGCGRQGCLETEASRLAISAEAAKAAFRGEAPYLLAQAGTDLSKIRSGVLAASIAEGDQVVKRIVQRAAGLIGVAVSDFVHLLAPDVVVLGGGLVEAMPELFVQEVACRANQRVMRPFVDTFQVVAAELGDDATVLGAAAWARTVATG